MSFKPQTVIQQGSGTQRDRKGEREREREREREYAQVVKTQSAQHGLGRCRETAWLEGGVRSQKELGLSSAFLLTEDATLGKLLTLSHPVFLLVGWN